jgi:hypothetical protein
VIVFDAHLELEQQEALQSELERERLAADRARRIRALAGSIAYHAWASSHLTEGLSPVLYGVCLDKAARIIDALDALPVPAKQEVAK